MIDCELEESLQLRIPLVTVLKKIDVIKYPEAAEEYDVVACPTLIFPNFMRVCGCYETEIIEELISTYFASAFEFQTIKQPEISSK